MSKEVSIRYLQDRDGEEYFPVTHIEAVFGLGVYLDKIENLKKENEELKKEYLIWRRNKRRFIKCY
ncbi:hypothetical protein KB234_08965 [Staphylococcus epidermidis]|jgi:hypothetical protein|uniref:hypothetical protein n=1 Tax=Staphylococcus epidermidis TaxID=1282 RepID=UPI00164274D4|nr:hypothetical protein [Staphylococcus epidermidis]MBM5874028.1 hypothetical protein [Staphylococcus epidermidis]MBM6084332.1 hypothetical protein [Staphylococcus epidermidis]MBM6146492.1 hypothetical protein [Staphylococcus epidermidis]MBM6155547.1 hypothetical protein [Staphylococcus epidermidis]MBM6157779.1 hypothetical protein [Staphylococcus epidermidis]